MGNVKSFCCKDYGSDIDDREERSRILNGDNCGSSNDLYNNLSNSAQDLISYGSINNGNSNRTMEQSALDKIYQKMAANVIDVAPGESIVIQPAEFMERQKAYQARLNQIKTPLPLKSNNRVTKQNMNISSGNNNNSSSSSGALADSRLNTTSPHSANPNTNLALNSSTTSNLFPNNNSQAGNLMVGTNSIQNMSKSQEKRRVEYEPITSDEIQLINEISERSVKAVKSLKIDSQEQDGVEFILINKKRENLLYPNIFVLIVVVSMYTILNKL